MDIFLDEDVAYARRLIDDAVPVEAHIWNGALHGFDYVAPRIALSRTAWDKRIAFVRSHL
jgi:acetyl esterase/lipase